MSRLPQPGADAGQWGDILNDYLRQAHNSDGTLKTITISNVENLSDTLSQKPDSASLSAVARSGLYQDLVDRPSFGSAAQEDTDAFATAVQGKAAETLLTTKICTIEGLVTATSINTALRNVSDAGGGIVLLPPGSYTIDAPIGDATARLKHTQLIGAGRRGINGPGMGGTILTASGNFSVITGVWESCVLANFGINAANLGGSGINGHFFTSVLSDLEVVGWKTRGVSLNDGSLSDEIGLLNRMQHCFVADTGSESGIGVYVGYRWGDSWIEGNNIESPDTDLVIETGSTFRILNNHLNGNRHPTHCVEVKGAAVDVMLANNIFEGYRKEAIVLWGDNWTTTPTYADVSINANIFRSDATDGTSPVIALRGDIVDWGGAVLSGFRMKGVGITSNTFRSVNSSTPALAVVDVYDVDNVSIVGNVWVDGRVRSNNPVRVKSGSANIEIVGNGGDNATTTL